MHENEFRFVAVVPKEKAGAHEYFSLGVKELSKFKMEIVTNPFMTKWQIENLSTLLKTFNLESFLTNSKMVIKQ